jgi:hypothetical protein
MEYILIGIEYGIVEFKVDDGSHSGGQQQVEFSSSTTMMSDGAYAANASITYNKRGCDCLLS